MAKQQLEANLSLNTKDFQKGLDDAKRGVGGFSRDLVSLGAGIGVLTGLLFKLKDAFLETEQGARTLSVASSVLKQSFREILKGPNNPMLLANLVTAGQLGREADDLRKKQRQDMLDIADMQTHINKLMFEAADQGKTESERIALLTKAKAAQETLTTMMVINLDEELALLYKDLAVGGDISGILDEINKKLVERKELEGRVIEYKRLESQMTGLQRQEQERLNEAYRTSLQYLETGYKLAPLQGKEKVTTGRGTGLRFSPAELPLANMAGADIETNTIVEQNKLWAEQEQIILSLADSFSRMFSQAGDGFQSMVNMVLAGVKRMVIELIAKAAVLALLSMFFPGRGILSFANLIPGLAGLAGGGKGGGGLGAMSTGTPGFVRGNPINSAMLLARIKGSDIQIALDRSASLRGAGT